MSKIVSATASMSAHGSIGHALALQQRVTAAIVAAVERCRAEGITDVEAIRLAQIEARDQALGG